MVSRFPQGAVCSPEGGGTLAKKVFRFIVALLIVLAITIINARKAM
jgi:hypothetical protein